LAKNRCSEQACVPASLSRSGGGLGWSRLVRDDYPQIDLDYVLAQSPYLVDVRPPDEFACGHFPGAIHKPDDDLRDELAKLH
jgi:hypothetical protein